jgi:23S rRNA-/tRNA-specific pseudouridylate synthase
VLLVAENHAVARALSRAFMQGEVHKEYLALVRGRVEAPGGILELPIGDATDSEVYTRRAAGHGQQARTRWRVERRGRETSLLRVFPETGRRHQIRVHLASIGHPILGDILYGRDDRGYLDLVRGRGDVRVAEGGPLRQLLHCARLVFPDPRGEGRIEVAARLPEEFAAPEREA